MAEKRPESPNRRDFLRRVSSVAVFTPPLMMALGSTSAGAASAYEKFNADLQQAVRLTGQTRRLTREFSGRAITEAQFKALGRPIRALKEQADSLYEWHGNGWPPRP